MKKIRGTVTTCLLAGILMFSIGVGSAWANEDAAETTITSESNATVIAETEGEAVEPSLKYGDFFYFIKITLENIQLLINANDLKEAQLLAKFAQERIAEANALFAEGKDDLANQTIKKAIEQQEKAVVLSTELESEVEATNEDTDGEASDEENANAKVELEAKFFQNIESLAKVMEKVENPKAKAAIAKNIEKSFGKLEKKLGKLVKEQNETEDGSLELNLDTKVKLGKPELQGEKGNKNK
ncbi:MAG TPA: DUF5667 domain-containing protein [Bacilli bacterium]